MGHEHLTVAVQGLSELKIRGSRFLGLALHVATEHSALEAVEQAKRARHDARHHCYAFRLGPAGEQMRSNDDGEPSGSAGAPILQQLESRDLTDALVIVTRYFGGTKLGRGGLARAYGETARLALDDAGTRKIVHRTAYVLTFDYSDTARAMHVVDTAGGRVVRSSYSDATELVVEVPAARTGQFERHFIEHLAGRGEIRRIDESVSG